MLIDEAHTVAGGCQHGIHIAALNIQFNALVAGHSLEDARGSGERHSVGKSGENFTV